MFYKITKNKIQLQTLNITSLISWMICPSIQQSLYYKKITQNSKNKQWKWKRTTKSCTLAEIAETAAVLMAVMTSPSMTCRLETNHDRCSVQWLINWFWVSAETPAVIFHLQPSRSHILDPAAPQWLEQMVDWSLSLFCRNMQTLLTGLHLSPCM